MHHSDRRIGEILVWTGRGAQTSRPGAATTLNEMENKAAMIPKMDSTCQIPTVSILPRPNMIRPARSAKISSESIGDSKKGSFETTGSVRAEIETATASRTKYAPVISLSSRDRLETVRFNYPWFMVVSAFSLSAMVGYTPEA